MKIKLEISLKYTRTEDELNSSFAINPVTVYGIPEGQI